MRSTSPELQDGRHGSAWCPPPRATIQPRCATSTTPRARSGRGLGSRGQRRRTADDVALARCGLRLRTAATALFQRLIADGTLPAGYATDDGAGVLYRGTEFVDAVSEYDGAAAYFVDSDGVVERRLDTCRL